jgi:hypothetical protein
MREMLILDASGHTTKTWDPTDAASLQEVQAEFDKLVENGYAAFAAEVAGGPSRKIETFDPNAGELLMVPQLVGG